MKILIAISSAVFLAAGAFLIVQSTDQRNVEAALAALEEESSNLNELSERVSLAKSHALKIRFTSLREATLTEIERVNSEKKRQLEKAQQATDAVLKNLEQEFDNVSLFEAQFERASEEIASIGLPGAVEEAKKMLADLYERERPIVEQRQADRLARERERREAEERARRRAEEELRRERQRREAAEERARVARREADERARREAERARWQAQQAAMCCCQITYYEADNYDEDWTYKDTSYEWKDADDCRTTKRKTLNPFVPDKKWSQVCSSRSYCGR